MANIKGSVFIKDVFKEWSFKTRHLNRGIVSNRKR